MRKKYIRENSCLFVANFKHLNCGGFIKSGIWTYSRLTFSIDAHYIANI